MALVYRQQRRHIDQFRDKVRDAVATALVEPPEWAEELRHDLDVIGQPSVVDLEPVVHLQQIRRRLRQVEETL